MKLLEQSCTVSCQVTTWQELAFNLVGHKTRLIFMATCKKCEGYINWKETATGWEPRNRDGTYHYKTCLYPNKPLPPKDSLKSRKYSNTIIIDGQEY